jgi:alpha-L-fucosidase
LQRFGDGRDWFAQQRLGLMAHWGLYALGGWHEQEQWRRRLPRALYAELAARFNPSRFDPEAWLDLAESCGASYFCLTAKHHDGFCLWDSDLTDFKVTNTPYGRDIVAQVAEACARRGLPLCLYYSVVDWRHPNYPNQGRHHELPPQPQDQPDWPRYLDYLRGQASELCRRYGPLGGFWWDMNVEQHLDPSINALIRQLQPGAVINDRGFDGGDFGTPERQDGGGADSPFGRPTEACQSLGLESWGYRADETWHSDRFLQRSAAAYLARGANYLLNVGPTAEGEIPPVAQAMLRRLGQWYQAVRPALRGTEPATGLTDNGEVLLTRRERTLYVIVHREPRADAVKLKPLAAAPRRAWLLNDGRPVDWAVEMLPSDHEQQQAYLVLKHLPVNELSATVMVIGVEFEAPPVGTDDRQALVRR